MKKPRAVDNAANIDPHPAGADSALFNERYRVVEVESQRLTIRGIRSGKVLTITNPNPEIPLSAEDYPVGKLIALSDPSRAVMD